VPESVITAAQTNLVPQYGHRWSSHSSPKRKVLQDMDLANKVTKYCTRPQKAQLKWAKST